MLLKQTKVLDQLVPHENDVVVRFVRDTGEEPYLCVEMKKEDWDDMGQPEMVTITIEPGNKLEEEYA